MLKNTDSPQLGLFWNSRESQENRFKILSKLLLKYSKTIDKILRIADIGCGYGDLNSFLLKNFVKKFSYKGYDINPQFIDYCKNLIKKSNENFFFVSDYPLETCDFSIMNGTYNYAINENIYRWEKYLIHNLEKCYKTQKLVLFLTFNTRTHKNRK